MFTLMELIPRKKNLFRLEQDEPSLSNSPFNSTQQFISKVS